MVDGCHNLRNFMKGLRSTDLEGWDYLVWGRVQRTTPKDSHHQVIRQFGLKEGTASIAAWWIFILMETITVWNSYMDRI